MKVLCAVILTVFFCAVTRVVAKWTGLPYDEVAIGCLAYFVFHLAACLADGKGGDK